jgi:hypothetical protein
MIPQAVQLTLPVWAQAILALAAILANVATLLFVVFVLWPSIRSQERRAGRIEKWMDGPEGARAKAAVLSKIEGSDGLDQAGSPVDKSEWTKGINQGGDL